MKKELLAVLRFTREYSHYPYGRQFLVHLEHNSLTWLLHFKHAEHAIAHWLEECRMTGLFNIDLVLNMVMQMGFHVFLTVWNIVIVMRLVTIYHLCPLVGVGIVPVYKTNGQDMRMMLMMLFLSQYEKHV